MAEVVFTIDIPELYVIKKHWATAPATLKAMTRATLLRAAISTQGIARMEAPVKTGRLRNSIDFEVTEDKAVVFTHLNYANYVHGGTGVFGPERRPITPKNKKILATTKNPGWGTRNAAGYYIIGKSSKGQKANPFMKRAADMSRPLVKTEFREMMKAFITEMEKV